MFYKTPHAFWFAPDDTRLAETIFSTENKLVGPRVISHLADYKSIVFYIWTFSCKIRFMISRPFWISRIMHLWKKRSIIWLSGVRRVGKTSLCHQIPDADYLNCDLPSVQRPLADPEFFFSAQEPGKKLLMDEIHQTDNPSSTLKIAADAFPNLFILATGSSTLHATHKFRDALTGRKHTLHLLPVLWRECCKAAFAINNLDQRLLNGGFPELLLQNQPDPLYFAEWIDSFFARDIQELFGVRNRTGFLSLLQLICLRSGGQLEVTDLAKKAKMSRPTVMSHLDAMEIAHAMIRIPPFFGGSHREIIRQPKIYAFDTGLVAYVRGWESIRDSDRGHLWEHLVLDELRASYPDKSIHYWSDKSQREINFVVVQSAARVDVIEAKINPDAFDTAALKVFRNLYPQGRNFVMCPFMTQPYRINKNNFEIRVGQPHQLLPDRSN